MNYVGSISIIDRGDAPAKAVIDKNTRSLAQRVADETKEELDKVMDRVDNIYVSYEMSTQTMFENPRGSPNVEYIEDIKELEEIITDTVKKKKYQQQVTVFVVGFQDVCTQKMQLLQQVNQFFLDNSKLDEDELMEEKPEIDLEEASNKVNESLSTAEELAKKLSDLNQDIIEWLVNYANTKASNKGKKRLEKNLESAKTELTDLSEKLLKLQTELEEKDEKFQQVAKQLEAKSQEAIRYKTAAEVAKKSAQDNEAHTSVLQEEITRRDEKIIELRTKLSRLEINLTESNFDKEMSTRKLDNSQAQTKLFEIYEEKEDMQPERLAKLQEEVDNQKMAVGDAEREMDKLHREQLANLHHAHQQEITELKKEHEEEIVKLTEELLSFQEQAKVAEKQTLEATWQSEDLRTKLFELQLRETSTERIDDPISRESSAKLSGRSIGELSPGEDEQPSRQIGLYTLSPDESIRPLSSYSSKKATTFSSESRQSNKDTKKKSETLKPAKAPSKSPNRIGKEKVGRGAKDFADASIQDEGGDASKAFVEKSNDPSRQATRQSKNLEPVIEGDGSEFPNAFDLDDEDSWSSVPPQHMPGRFLQYRQLGRAKIKDLEEQLQVTLTKTHRKVNSLKSQFSEHKTKWETERKVLIEQVEQAQKLQTDAEKEADAAMTQLEEFINEQEKLEDEEEQKRQEIIKTMSRPGTVKQTTPVPAEHKPQPDVKPDEQGDRLQSENSEQELKNLMQQTDDAKAQKHARQTGAISAPPAVEPDDGQAQKLETFEEDFESKPVTSRERKTDHQSDIGLDDQKPVSPPKEAFRTPRSFRSKSLQSDASEESANPDEGVALDVGPGHSDALNKLKSLSDQKPVSPPKEAFRTPRSVPSKSSQSEKNDNTINIDTNPDEDVTMHATPGQADALHDLKSVMAADNLTLEQQKTFESLKSVIKSLSEEQALRDMQLERTVTILSIASQITQESVENGELPDNILDRFSKMGSRGMSGHWSGQRSVKGSAMSKINDNLVARDEDKLDKDIEVSLVKEQKSKSSKAIRSGVPNRSLEMMQEKTKEMLADENSAKTKGKLSESLKEFSFTGSDAADFLSSRGDSFSASLPRTLTSSEWRRLSPHDPFSPNAEKRQKQQDLLKEEKLKEKNQKAKADIITKTKSDSSMKDLSYQDDGAETKMSTISVVISPKKKSRPVTMEQMLYGEGSLDVAPTGLVTAMDIIKDDMSESRSPYMSRPPSEKCPSPPCQRSVTDCETNSLMSLETDASSVSEIQTDQSDLAINDLEEEIIVEEGSDNAEKIDTHVAEFPSNRSAKITKFQCVSKVLTLEFETGQKHRLKNRPNITKTSARQADRVVYIREDDNFHNLDTFAIKGTDCSHTEKYPDTDTINSRQHPSRSRSFGGYSKSIPRSDSFALDQSLTEKGSLSNRLALLADRNKYHVGFSEFGDIPKLTSTDVVDNINPKPPIENMFPPKWKFKKDNVVIATENDNTCLQNFEVKDMKSAKQESHTESVHGDRTARSSDQSRQSSSSSHIPPRYSAKSKRSTLKSENSTHSEIQPPKSPSTLGRVSPVTLNRASPVTINRSPRTSATPGTLVSDVQRPVSISSVQPKICDSPPPDLHKYHPLQFSKETQTEEMLSQIEHEPVKGNTDEEVRQSSAKSRASLRNQFKSRLDETRQAVEERRTKSPVIMVPTQKSIDDELIIEDDDDLPIPDDLKEEVLYRDDTLDAGTSPPPAKQEAGRKISMASRKSTNLAEHPVVQEFLRAYTGIHNFKEAMSRVLVDKDQMSASQILSDIDVIPFNTENKVVPQVSTMTENIYYVLNEVSQVINSVLQNDRGPVVSSLMMGMSRDATQRTIMREKSGATGDIYPRTRESQRTVSTKAGSTSTDAAQYQELQAQYEKLQQKQNEMSEESKKYEDQQRHNVVVMMEMQDTINQLQRELSALGKQTRRPMSESMSTAGAQNADSAIMFTRLDSERNAKIMKKAVNEKKLDANRYKEAMVQMDEYVNLPAQRLAHLVRKYVHHCRMKEIEENVQKSQSLNENVFELFDKMEALQNQRAKRWADRMDEMGIERYRLANMLMETLDSIEQESGLFLIKPMYSYRGREPKEQPFSGKITRPFRPHRTLSPLRDNNSAHAPAPTPASNVRPRNQARRDDMYQSQTAGQVQYERKGPLEGDTTGLMGSSMGYMGGQPRSTWSMADSQMGMNNPMFGNVNTPRILELDINRMMIGQNTISAQIGNQGLSNDRLVNAANNNLRAYMTVNRPGPNSAGKADRPHSGSRQSPRPSSSPTNHSASTAKRVRLSDVEIPTVMSSSQPLPPIGHDKPKSGSTKGSRSPPRIPVGNELPESPPGSSLRHSPPGMEDTEVTSPVK